MPVTLTSTTGRPLSRKAPANCAARRTISSTGCTVGRVMNPFCSSITMSAGLGSIVLSVILVLFPLVLSGCCRASFNRIDP
jgi:hypothetical protein